VVKRRKREQSREPGDARGNDRLYVYIHSQQTGGEVGSGSLFEVEAHTLFDPGTSALDQTVFPHFGSHITSQERI
jgi:hypothetical protein